MKYIILIVVVAASCKSKTDIPVQLPTNVFVEATDTALHNMNGTWIWYGKIFTGYIIEKGSSNILSKMPVIAGKEHGVATGWFKNGKKKYERNYINGNRDGVHRGWYENDSLAFEYYFKNDKYEGNQKSFFESGHLWQSLNYINGYEEGKQKSWNDSGRVVNNFTVKNGKLYGVIGRFDCMSVHKK